MPEPSTEKPKRGTHAFKLRMRTETLALIDRAAQALGRSRSDFIIDAACPAAEDAILDQAVITTDRESHDRFLAILDRPPESNERLRTLMRTPAPWEAR
jgi:uncharacterized protein (DUF1778 family)